MGGSRRWAFGSLSSRADQGVGQDPPAELPLLTPLSLFISTIKTFGIYGDTQLFEAVCLLPRCVRSMFKCGKPELKLVNAMPQ
jgi:hypothetical protein